MLDEGVAGRYAEALFEIGGRQGTIPQLDDELKRMSAAWTTNPALSGALAAPNIPDQVKKDIVRKVFGVGYSPVLVNFLFVMVDHRRAEVFPAAASAFHELRLAAEGQIRAQVETAVDVPAELRAEVESRVSRHTGRRAILEWTRNPALLGGVVVRIKDKLIDYSLQRQLEDIKQRMLASS